MENKYEGIITEKLIKKTYWQIKLDIGNERIVTLNTKDEGFWTGLKIGEQGEFMYRESEIPGTQDDQGNPFKMKWIILDNQSPRMSDAPQGTLDFGLYLRDISSKVDTIIEMLEDLEPKAVNEGVDVVDITDIPL